MFVLPPQIPVEEMAAQYALLSREHQGLQKSYQLLASTAAHTSSTPEYHGKGTPVRVFDIFHSFPTLMQL